MTLPDGVFITLFKTFFLIIDKEYYFLYDIPMDIEEISKKIEALASTSRLKILCLLSLHPFCVCDLANVLQFSQPTLTRHLQKLEEAGFVKATRHKFYTIYSLHYKDEMVKIFLETLLPLLKNTPEFKELAEQLSKISDSLKSL